MKFLKVKNMEELSLAAAGEFIKDAMQENVNLAIPGGSTPAGMYELISPIVKGNPAMATANYYNLDEVMNADGSIRANLDSLEKMFYTKNEIPTSQRNYLLETNYKEFEKTLADRGGLDVAYLGVGIDGHIAGIIPGVSFDETIYVGKNNQHFIDLVVPVFGSEANVPENVVSAGAKVIMDAKKIVMLVAGPNKKEIVKKAFFGPITEEVPASILQLHPNITVILDEEAAALVPSI